MKTHQIIKKTVYTALFAALIFVATVVIHIHIPFAGAEGYVNFGDCTVLVSGVLLGPLCGGLAAGIGSAMADAMYGHWIYTPGTFVIKALMAIVAYIVYCTISKNKEDFKTVPLSVASICGETVMVVGYVLYETLLFSFPTAVLGIVANIAQATAGIILTVLILRLMKKTNITESIKF